MSDLPYWGGSGVNLGSVRPLSCATFDAFVNEQLGHPVLLASISRKEFLALPKKQRDEHKRVSFFTPAAFKSEHRVAAEALHCNLICLDIDDPAQAAPFVSATGSLVGKLRPFAFAAYLTANSTPENPRLRIVVSAREIPLERYAQAVRWLGETLLGLPSVTGESKVAVQPMYRPTIFRDDDPVEDHPLIVAVPGGAVITDRHVVGKAASPDNPPPKTVEPNAEDLEFLRPAVEEVTFEDVRTALFVLDPDCSYSEWIEVAAALHHQFPYANQEEGAFELFNDWSQRGVKYTTEEDTLAKWGSFKATPRGRAPVTIRTVFHRAMAAGWAQGAVLAERCYGQIRSWIDSKTKTGAALLEEGLQKVSTAPVLSEPQKALLLKSLADASGIARGEVKTMLARMERQAQQSLPSAAELPRWARGLCYVSTQNEFFQRHTGRKFKPESLDNTFGSELMRGATERGQPLVKPRDYLLNVMRCAKVDDYVYSPADADEIFVNVGQRRAVNLYIPTYPELDTDPAAVAAAGQILEDHIRGHLVAEAAYQDILLDFFTYHVQKPGRKIRWAVLLQGAQGCGKTVLAEMMRAVLGPQHVRSIGAEALFAGFNGWSYGSQLCTIEEVRVVGHNRHEVMNSLKPCISNDFITVNEKFEVPYQTPNTTNYLMFTNHHDSLAVSDGDRRYFVLESPLQDSRQVRALGESYFDRLWGMVRTKGGALRAWFEQRKISPAFNPDSHAPSTPYLGELATAAATPLAAAVNEVLVDGLHPLATSRLAVIGILRQILETRRGLEVFSDQTLAAVLRERGMRLVGRYMIDGERMSIWVARESSSKDWVAEVRLRLAEKDALLQ